MKKKSWYIVPLLLIILFLLGPIIHNTNKAHSPVPVNTAGSVARAPTPAPGPAGEPGNTDPAPPASDDVNSSSGNSGATITTAPASTAEPGKESLSSPAETPDSQAVTVNIAVVGKGGELLFGPGQVEIPANNQRETTALGVLAATGLQYEVSKRYPDFIEAIAGQRNKGQAGWLYKINEEVPLVAANKKTVAAGDYVIWWYSSSINAPPPIWEELQALE